MDGKTMTMKDFREMVRRLGDSDPNGVYAKMARALDIAAAGKMTPALAKELAFDVIPDV